MVTESTLPSRLATPVHDGQVIPDRESFCRPTITIGDGFTLSGFPGPRNSKILQTLRRVNHYLWLV